MDLIAWTKIDQQNSHLWTLASEYFIFGKMHNVKENILTHSIEEGYPVECN